ncbi:hypothetical protein T4A_13931 [Trichinella pseudospiralis]|uniref:Uncharacterized protein n=1 Tax=Trichinella pseudospiralis TaxID=6337 RepID=A0A0V1DMY4_TRIPS|nr:hypothetical protein T4A_8308 [Trichinella pseudospiralis]KRY62909.1 hypothetical protein T4A_13931 [Trichinella pseudospiralis]
MAFYMDLNEKCNVHGDDFKNRLFAIFTYKYTLVDKGRRN